MAREGFLPELPADKLAAALAAATENVATTKPTKMTGVPLVRHELPIATPRQIDFIAERFASAA